MIQLPQSPGNPAASSPTTSTTAAGAGMNPLEAQHDAALSMYDKTSEWMWHQQTLSDALSKLGKLGDLVTADDVIKAAGKLVSTGTHSPMEMASILADMPQAGSSAIASWLQALAAKNAQTTQQVTAMHKQAQHKLGVAAMGLLMQDHNSSVTTPTASPATGNTLSTGGPASG
jgi:hypothetical protein